MGLFDGLLAEILGLVTLVGVWVTEALAGVSAFFVGLLS